MDLPFKVLPSYSFGGKLLFETGSPGLELLLEGSFFKGQSFLELALRVLGVLPRLGPGFPNPKGGGGVPFPRVRVGRRHGGP